MKRVLVRAWATCALQGAAAPSAVGCSQKSAEKVTFQHLQECQWLLEPKVESTLCGEQFGVRVSLWKPTICRLPWMTSNLSRHIHIQSITTLMVEICWLIFRWCKWRWSVAGGLVTCEVSGFVMHLRCPDGWMDLSSFNVKASHKCHYGTSPK